MTCTNRVVIASLGACVGMAVGAVLGVIVGVLAMRELEGTRR